MPGLPEPAHQAFLGRIARLEARLRALETQQQLVFTDPTGSTGDPAHGNAVLVVGYLGPICSISAYGAASYRTGSWVAL